MAAQPVEDRLGGPLVALRRPVLVVRPLGVRSRPARRRDPFVLVDDGDAERVGHAAEEDVPAGLRVPHGVRGQDGERGAVAVGGSTFLSMQPTIMKSVDKYYSPTFHLMVVGQLQQGSCSHSIGLKKGVQDALQKCQVFQGLSSGTNLNKRYCNG